MTPIGRIHHITAIASAADRNLTFHESALGCWQQRLAGLGITVEGPAERFGERLISSSDQDGLFLELVEHEAAAGLPGRAAEDVPVEHAIPSFRRITLWVEDPTATARVLTEVLGYEPGPVEGARRASSIRATGSAGSSICGRPRGSARRYGAGVVHRVALRAADDAIQAAATAALTPRGIRVNTQQDQTPSARPISASQAACCLRSRLTNEASRSTGRCRCWAAG
jgi:glyoxalase family protein